MGRGRNLHGVRALQPVPTRPGTRTSCRKTRASLCACAYQVTFPTQFRMLPTAVSVLLWVVWRQTAAAASARFQTALLDPVPSRNQKRQDRISSNPASCRHRTWRTGVVLLSWMESDAVAVGEVLKTRSGEPWGIVVPRRVGAFPTVFDPRRGGRVVEGAGLENRYTRKGIAGSNPALSAIV